MTVQTKNLHKTTRTLLAPANDPSLTFYIPVVWVNKVALCTPDLTDNTNIFSSFIVCCLSLTTGEEKRPAVALVRKTAVFH